MSCKKGYFSYTNQTSIKTVLSLSGEDRQRMRRGLKSRLNSACRKNKRFIDITIECTPYNVKKRKNTVMRFIYELKQTKQ